MSAIKVFCFGDENIGKTSIIKRIVDNEFSDEYIHTANSNEMYVYDCLGIDYNIFDSPNFIIKEFDKTAVFFLIFDITNKESYDSIVDNWLPFVLSIISPQDLIYIIGNGVDKEENRVISLDDLTLPDGIRYFETSARTNENIRCIVEDMSSEIIRRILIQMILTTNYIPQIETKSLGTLSQHFTYEYFDMNKQLGKEIICSVCLDTINFRDDLKLSKCCHIYCKGCIERLDKCGVCRSED
jgi:GTPase SAR1 family protein